MEYWLLLHFMNHNEIPRSFQKVTNLLAPFMKGCFPTLVLTVKFKKLIKIESIWTMRHG